MAVPAGIPATVANALSERAFQSQVLDLAHQLGWRSAHWHDSRRQVRPGVHVGDKDAAGFPDIVLCRPPELLVIELKAQKGRLTDTQLSWLQDLGMCDIDVFVWRPADWPEILERLSRRPPEA